MKNEAVYRVQHFFWLTLVLLLVIVTVLVVVGVGVLKGRFLTLRVVVDCHGVKIR